MPRKLGWAAAALAALALMSGCAKKVTVDSSFTQPEGSFSNQLELFTFMDTPNSKIRIKDRGQIGRVDFTADTSNADSIARDPNTGALLITPIQSHSPGTVRGMVLNRTPAEGIEIYRTDPNGAVRRILDFAVQPQRRWLDRGAEIYEFADSDPNRSSTSTYFARGLIGGVGGASSPISNGSRPETTPLADIRYLAARWGTLTGGFWFQAESTFVMKWSPVTGASKYLIHVFEYQARSLSLRERVLTGAPAPVLTLGSRDIFIASVPSTITEYKMGNPGATIYTFRTPRLRGEYYVRISAIDADGQMIGMTTGPTITQTAHLRTIPDIRDYFTDFSDLEVAGASPPAYLLYARGAARVSPGENPNP